MSPVSWAQSPFPRVSLDAAGLVSLADLSTVAKRTALTGTSNYLDVFIISPGFHRQQSAPDLNSGEYPACGALTSGYVFRVENPATVVYLQKVGRTGQLTTLKVSRRDEEMSALEKTLNAFFMHQNASLVSALAYLAAASLTVVSFVLLGLALDYWGVTVLSVLMFSRLLNTWVIRQRSRTGWHGQPEPGVNGDLLILLSQDRWVRLQGPVDDLKAVTSGQWLRDQTFFQSCLSAIATLLVYLDAALASNVHDSGKLILFILLIASAGLLGIANEWTESLVMHGCKVEMKGERKTYGRRLKLVQELLKEKDRNDDAMHAAFAQMGMTVPEKSGSDNGSQKQVTM